MPGLEIESVQQCIIAPVKVLRLALAFCNFE